MAGLVFGPLGAGAVHVCVDMQRLFAAGSAWHAPWLERVLPVVERVAVAWAERTVFTRFIRRGRRGTWGGRGGGITSGGRG